MFAGLTMFVAVWCLGVFGVFSGWFNVFGGVWASSLAMVLGRLAGGVFWVVAGLWSSLWVGII